MHCFESNRKIKFSTQGVEITVQQLFAIAHDRSKEVHWKFNRPVAAKTIQLQNPPLRFLKTTKGNFSGEGF